MPGLFRELKEQLSPERRKRVEERAQFMLNNVALKSYAMYDASGDLSEQEIDQAVIAQVDDDVAWEEPIVIHGVRPILSITRLSEPTSAENLESLHEHRRHC